MESSGGEEVNYEKLGARPRGQTQPELLDLPVEPADTAIKDQLTKGAVGAPESHPTMTVTFHLP
jgi:hypothetical protein